MKNLKDEWNSISTEGIMEAIGMLQSNNDNRRRFNECKTVWEQQALFRKYYQDNEETILRFCRGSLKAQHNPYSFDWIKIFTPIEDMAWQVIRCAGIALYPQYPVLNYMVDFGNPLVKIGLELDGKAYHDPVKDLKRDQEIYDKTGWKIFRVSGSVANRIVGDFPNRYPEYYEDVQALEYYLRETLEGVVDCLYMAYFFRRDPENEDDEAYYCRCMQALGKHRLAKFPL